MAFKEKLTDEIADKIAEYNRATGLFCDAAVHAGIGKRTALNWRRLGQTSLSGKYFEFEQKIAAASSEMMAPIVNMLLLRARGGVSRQPKKRRYVDAHGVHRETNEAVLDEDGRPVYEIIVIEPDPKVAMFLAERLRPAEFAEKSTLQIDDANVTERTRQMEAAMCERERRLHRDYPQSEWKDLPGAPLKQIGHAPESEAIEPEICEENDND
jgi:hypothetical protein